MSQRTWPAIDVAGADADLLLAELDDFSPAAIDDHAGGVRVFFASDESRGAALAHLASVALSARPVDVPDEDWGRRSQDNITPIVVGRICVTPPWHLSAQRASAALLAPPGLPALPARSAPIFVVIEPSMGFGTGHHATTRLCVAALQRLDLHGKRVLDVGTGSGVLAIAASMLGASDAVGIDYDADAIQNARENLALNPAAANVGFEVADLARGLAPASADVVVANITGAALQRAAGRLLAAVRPGGTLILSGLLVSERAAVEAAFGRATLVDAAQEDEWVALVYAGQPRTA